MLVPYLITVFGTYAGATITTVQVQPSMDICNEAVKIHLEIPRSTPAFSGIPDIKKPILVKCEEREVPSKN